jgi:hypothetical protein
MKIALCISGYFSNKNNDDLLESNYIYDNVVNPIKQNGDNLDIFIHSFDKYNEHKILTKYPNTKDCIIQDQIDFINNLQDSNYKYYNMLRDHKYEDYGFNLQSTLSFLYSRSKCIKLALQYSKEQDFVYDCIIKCRFDIGIRLKQPFDGYKPDNLVFNPLLDFNYIYSSYWNQLNAGYNDFWEFSNSANMEIFSNIYDYAINNMFIPDSEYLNTLNNWPDSNEDDWRTNEILNINKSDKLKKYDFISSSNNHLIEKFFMLKCGLYSKSKFLDFTPNVNKIIYG